MLKYTLIHKEFFVLYEFVKIKYCYNATFAMELGIKEV